ncbi:MAG: alpha-1,2-fucosyltransferase [Lachnospiraceae bacterium]|nr:alpha-1,2-fucosyltransferase [Lachnospiraceae bacterium]
MVIVHLSGGFGNQLFSYAFGYVIAKKRNDAFAIDTAIQDEAWFFRNPEILNMEITYDKRVSYRIKRKLPDRALLNKIRYHKAIGFSTKELRENEMGEMAPNQIIQKCTSEKAKNIYLRGNWQRPDFFIEYENEIRQKFKFHTELSEEAIRVANEMRATHNTVAIHYRRGDYVKVGVCPAPDYFINAISKMAELIDNPIFYCFSEDLEWVKEQFMALPYDIRYPEYESERKDMDDFQLITLAENQIISNSSYSWWAAFLNEHPGKKVIIPCEEKGLWSEEFGMPEWIKMPFHTLQKK